jgi:hypothetical protein
MTTSAAEILQAARQVTGLTDRQLWISSARSAAWRIPRHSRRNLAGSAIPNTKRCPGLGPRHPPHASARVVPPRRLAPYSGLAEVAASASFGHGTSTRVDVQLVEEAGEV